eukprot:TRINITY_DN8614_c0_g1_i1.p1 TRINITY_DN8614_c0_g1~~TRINITY_DN8614_c0_g1_i1.p1  ORF type:complete len:279 (+),score=75.62 TRINITY_DN8614_c0_g1_i1:69-905(+)
MEQWLSMNVEKVRQKMRSRRTSSLLPVLKRRFPEVEDSMILQVALQTNSSLIKSTEVLCELTGVGFQEAVARSCSARCCSNVEVRSKAQSCQESKLNHCNSEDVVMVDRVDRGEEEKLMKELLNFEVIPVHPRRKEEEDSVVLIDTDNNHIELPIDPEVVETSPFICTNYNEVDDGNVNIDDEDDEENQIIIKLIILSGDVENTNMYRFKVNPNKFGLKELMQDVKLKTQTTNEIKIKYKDEEGDLITVSHDAEWNEALLTLKQLSTSNVFKFYASCC